MPAHERVTVTLPADLVDVIDRLEKNRSRFVLVAVRNELRRRRRESLRESLAHPHSETTAAGAERGFDDWAASLPDESSPLVDLRAGKPVRWVRGKGWVPGK
jgi:hypothetical protein